MKVLFKNARILTMENDQIFVGNLVVKDSRIAYIGQNPESYGPFDREIDCKQNLLMPGFKNAHAHSAMVFLRDKGNNMNLQEWLFDLVFPYEAHLQKDDIYYLNKVAYLEYLAGGITACFEYYFYPDSSAKSAEEFGFRTLLLGTYDMQDRSVNELAKSYHLYNNRKESLVRYVLGFHAEYTASNEIIEKTKEAVDLLQSPFYTHISETQKECDECLQRHGMYPAKFLYEKGLFAYGGGGYHCVHFSDAEMDIFKKNNLFVISCPGSNKKLGSGIAPLTEYYKRGINISLGTDGPASNYALDMFLEMQLASGFQKETHHGEETIPAFEYLKMATVNAAKAMLLDECDVLKVGKYADIIMLDLHQPNMQVSPDIIHNIVYEGKVDNVILTMINGVILYENGKYFLKESLESIYQNAEKVIKRLDREVKK